MTLHPAETSDLKSGTWTIDPLHTTIGFAVDHLGIARVRCRFNSFSGVIEVGEDLTATTVHVSVELSSVDTNNAQRDNHLRSTDFFGITSRGALEPDGVVNQYPWMTFASTAIMTDSLAGELTINQITKHVEFDLEFKGVAALPAGEGLRIDGYNTTRAGFSANGHINRSDFGLDFNAPLGLSNVLIGDRVEIDLDVQAVRS